MSERSDRCMNVKKHPQLNMNPAFTQTGVRPLAALALFLFVSSFPAKAISSKETTTPKTFADWCLDRNNLSVETLRTVDVLLRVAETTDCNQASSLLSTRTNLSLNDKQIADLKPLSTLTNLISLTLYNNSITDLRPLSILTNLLILVLNNDPTLTDKTCPVQPESICRFVPLQSE